MPTELKTMKVWVVWRLEYHADTTKHWTKVPYAEKGGGPKRASTTDPTTWRTFDTVRFLHESSDYDGVGIVLQDNIVGIDLDNCRNPDTGELSATAKLIVSTVKSYTEISPSGTGVKILCRASVPGPRNRNQTEGIELYHRGSPRYFTITGHHVDGTPTTIEEREIAVEDVYRWYLRPLEEKVAKQTAALPPTTGDVTVDEIVAVASSASNKEKFKRLWEGEWVGVYGSQSEADLALCSILAFYAGNNPELIDRAFRASGLMRDKWEDREDYRERTLGMARADEVFDWEAHRRGRDNGTVTEEELQAAMRRAATTSTVIVSPQPVDAVENKFADIDRAVKEQIQGKGKKEKLTQPQTLIKLTEEGATLWKTPDQVGYATVKIENHLENWPINSKQFRRWLTGRYWDVLDLTAGEKAIKSAMEIIEHKALAGLTHEVHLRLARVGNVIFWDLANEEWECIEITAAGWKIVSNPPVKFRRTGQTATLPYPVTGGSLDDFRPLVRPDEDSWLLIKGFLLDCLKGRGPYQIMVITGEQGSAKSTLARFAKQLIDPVKKAPLCSLPQKEENLGIDGEFELVLAYDNVSHLSGWLSDAFCRLATGGGIKTRALYTNGEQYVVGFCRPLILNGIPDFADANDLLSRSILVTQPSIPQTERKTEEELMRQFEQAKPALLGALCDLVAGGLERIASTEFDWPRMADSAKWITACLGNTSYLERAAQSERDGIEAALEASHTAMILKIFLAGRTELDIEPNELLRKLQDTASLSYLNVTLPKNARALSSRLRRDAPAMREAWGIDVRGDKSHGKRLFRIRPWKGDAKGDETA
jgi:hypothetical protein